MTAGVSGKGLLRHGRAAATPDVHLVCLPHAGAGAASFNRWTGLFPPSVRVVRVQLPGREDVAAEPVLRRAGDAVHRLLPPVAELPKVALYGHSMGALVAFELARALTERGAPPVHLFVSGRRAPQLPAGRPPIHHLPDDAFTAELAAMGMAAAHTSPAFQRYTLPLIKADLELSEEYVYRPLPRLRCPVTAFHGTEDPVAGADQLAAWREATDGPFTVHTFPGDHFFHQSHREAIAATISTALE